MPPINLCRLIPYPLLYFFRRLPGLLSTSRPIPTEILAIIFAQLTDKDLYPCLFVSRHWHEAAEAQLYSEATLLLSLFVKRLDQPFFTALKARKHFLRKVVCRLYTQNDSFFLVNLLDILFDYRPPTGDIIDSDALVALRSLSLSASTAAERGFPGPNRPPLRHFTFTGEGVEEVLLDLVLFNLAPETLTTLCLYLQPSRRTEAYTFNVERILETYPNLKELGLRGDECQYTAKEQVNKDREPGFHQTGSVPHQQHRLESFTFGPMLMGQTGSTAFTIFQQLGNLKRIKVWSIVGYRECVVNCRPWGFGRALKEFCPKLESITIDGPALFWLFDLPILPYDKIPHITCLVHQNVPEDRLRERLRDHERKELLGGKTAVPFFPHLKKLILGYDHIVAAQDLLALGAQCQFLTHLEIHPSKSNTEAWEVYDRDDEYAISTTSSPILSEASSATRVMIENRRLQKRRPFNDRDLVLFLQVCSSLRYLDLRGCSVTFESLIDGYITAPSSGSAMTTPGTEAIIPYIRPWACADRIETLMIALDVPPKLPKDHHAVIWKHLGRLRRLQSLTLIPTKKQRYILVPSLDYGVEGLFQEGGLGETLGTLRFQTNWRLACEGREIVLCLAQWCPQLRNLGLEWGYSFDDCPEQTRADSFLKDEKVEQCSIRRIDIYHGRSDDDSISF